MLSQSRHLLLFGHHVRPQSKTDSTISSGKPWGEVRYQAQIGLYILPNGTAKLSQWSSTPIFHQVEVEVEAEVVVYLKYLTCMQFVNVTQTNINLLTT